MTTLSHSGSSGRWVKTLSPLCRRLLQSLSGGEVSGYHYFLHDLRGDRTRPHSTNPQHSHLGYEAQIVLDGRLTFQADGIELPVEAGRILVIPPNLRHSTRRSDESCLAVTLRFLTDPPLRQPLVLRVTEDPAVSRELQELLEEAEGMRAGWKERAQLRLTLILSLLLAILVPPPSCPEAERVDVSVAKRVDEYLQKHLPRSLTLADVAAALDMSPRTLVRRFRAETGDTVMARLQTLRIEAAVTLLVERLDLSAKQIASMVGMPDNAYFTNCFRRVTGMSPQRFRIHHLAVCNAEI